MLGKNVLAFDTTGAMRYCLLMTKKDFIAIAGVLDANTAPLATVLDFADMLEEDNPRFDRATFVRASTRRLAGGIASDARMLDRACKGQA